MKISATSLSELRECISLKGRKRDPTLGGAKLTNDVYTGSNLMGRLLMELRDNGKLEYHLPRQWRWDFIEICKNGELDK